MITIYEARQREQQFRVIMRQMAAELYPDARVPASAHVQIAEGGAFVEIEVWIPNDAIGKDEA